MINARELRIGNLVNYHMTENGDNNWQMVEWSLQSFHKMAEFDCSLDEAGYAPIPLTPELLERFGFELDKTDPMLYIRDGWRFRKAHFEYEFYKNHGLDWLASLKYVHQLQNLYFALTGTELILNPKP